MAPLCEYCYQYKSLTKIYPETLRHYIGSIWITKTNTYRVTIIYNSLKISKTFKTFGEAFLEIYSLNIKHNFPIKNIIYDFGDYMEVCLSQGKHMKFDPEQLDLVRTKLLYCDKNSDILYYALRGHENGLQNEIMNFKPIKSVQVVDHTMYQWRWS